MVWLQIATPLISPFPTVAAKNVKKTTTKKRPSLETVFGLSFQATVETWRRNVSDTVKEEHEMTFLRINNI